MSDQHQTTDGWMPLEDFCAKYDQREGTIHKRVHDGVWPRGEIYSSPSGGQAYVHEEKAAEWLRQRGKLKL